MTTKKAAENEAGHGVISRLRKFALGDAEVIPAPAQLEGRTLTPSTAAGSVDPAAGAGKTYLRTHPGELNIELTPIKSASIAGGYAGLVGQRHFDLLDEMVDKDIMIASSLGLAVGYLMMRPFALLAPTSELSGDPRMEEIIAFCENALEESNFSYLRWVMATGVQQHGSAVCEISWRVRPSDGKVVPERFFHCHPGQFMYSRAGEIYLYSADEKITPKPLAPMKFIHTAGFALYDNPFGQSVLYPLRFPYYFKKKALIAWMRYADKFGFPLAVGKIPPNTLDAETIKTGYLSALSRLGTDDALVLGAGEDLEFIQRGGANGGAPIHENVVDYFDRKIVRHILGAELTSTVTDKGARSLGEVHERTVLKRVLPFALMVDAAITRGLLAPLVALNFGADAPVPVAKTDIEESQTTEESIAILKIASEISIPVAVEQAQNWLGLRAPSPDEPILIGKAGPLMDGGPPMDDGPTPPVKGAAPGKGIVPFGERRSAWALRFSGIGGRAIGEAFTAEEFRGRVRADAARVAQEASDAQEALAVAAALSSRAGLRAVVVETANEIAHRYGGRESSMAMPDQARACVAIHLLNAEQELQAVAWIGRALAIHSKHGLLAPFAASPGEWGERFSGPAGDARFAVDKLPDEYLEASDWMVSRGVMTRREAASLAEAMAAEFADKSIDEWAREVRHEYLALAGSVDLAVTKKLQGIIAASVHSGQSVSGFLEGMDAATAQDGAGGLDGYWNMVYRTEAGLAYSEQQQAIERDPAFRSVFWGHEGMNPGDDRSRETHSSLNGVLFRKDGAAASILGYPPFAYQCRCALISLMDPDPQNSSYRESGSALSVAAGISRF